MVALDTLLKNLRLYFANLPAFSDVKFVCAFPGTVKASPLTRPVVSFSVKTMEEKDVPPVYSQVDEAAGEVPVLLYNHTVAVRLRVDVHVPQTGNGINCYEIYTRLSRHLMDMQFNIPVVGVGCQDLRYDRDMGAFSLYSYVDLYQTSTVS